MSRANKCRCCRKDAKHKCPRCGQVLHCSIVCAFSDSSHKSYCEEIPKRLKPLLTLNPVLLKPVSDPDTIMCFHEFEQLVVREPCYCEHGKIEFVEYFSNNCISYEKWSEMLWALFNCGITHQTMMHMSCLPTRDSLNWFKVIFTTLLKKTDSRSVLSLVEDEGLLEACLEYEGLCMRFIAGNEECYDECFLECFDEQEGQDDCDCEDCVANRTSKVLFSGFECLHEPEDYTKCEAYVLLGFWECLSNILELDVAMTELGFQKRTFWNKTMVAHQTIFHEFPLTICVIYFKEQLGSVIPRANQITNGSEIIRAYLIDKIKHKSFWKFTRAPLDCLLKEFGTDDFVDDVVLFFGNSNDHNFEDSKTIDTVLNDLQELENFKEFCLDPEACTCNE